MKRKISQVDMKGQGNYDLTYKIIQIINTTGSKLRHQPVIQFLQPIR